MTDALLSPAVGGATWAASAGMIAYCSRRVRDDLDERKTPLMGVLGAFVFAAQMINFAIPGTGSSGHLGGGLLLAVILGPHAAFFTIASVLVVQALFFADGGILALGSNMLNLGFFPAFVAYPLVYRKIVGDRPTPRRITVASLAAGVVGLQLGACCVVLETVASGVSSLPFGAFFALMQPIHLGIGLVEGVATAAVVSSVAKARPEILQYASGTGAWSVRRLSLGFLVAALLTGGIMSRFASEKPDGLEWSIVRLTGMEGIEVARDGVHGAFASLQERVAFLPDYAFGKAGNGEIPPHHGSLSASAPQDTGAGKAGTGVAGLVGGLIVLALSTAAGMLLRRRGTQQI